MKQFVKRSALAVLTVWTACAGAADPPPAKPQTWTGAASAKWADGGNWSGGAAPGAADDVVIEGGKFAPVLDLAKGAVTIKSLAIGKTVASTLTISNGNVTDKILIVKGDVTVGPTGVLTHARETATGTSVGDETQRLCLDVGGNLTIAAGGAIRVAGCGYGKYAGPIKANPASGGGHGGEGGFGDGEKPTPTYGSVTNPVTAGGGGTGDGGFGGGVVVIRVARLLTVDGAIDASGETPNGRGGGAGGSVNIRAGELAGVGSIIAKGGAAGPIGGGGGGGRIAVVVTNGAMTESVAMSVAGGLRGDKSAGFGAEGTIHVESAKPSPVVLDFSTLWRQFHVEGPSHLRLLDGKLKPTQIDWTDGPWHKHQEVCPWGENGLSVTNVFGLPGPRPDGLWTAPPPAEWTTPGFDDSAWPRLSWPQPHSQRLWATPGRFLYDTVLILARGTFEVKDPGQVTACRLSLAYRGGVVVYVNGKEVARGHLPAGAIAPATPAEDYPVEAFVGGDKPIVKQGAKLELPRERLALRERQLQDVVIPVSLLRPGRNVVAIEAHAAPMPENAYTTLRRQFGDWGGGPGWPLVGLAAGRLTVEQAAPVVAANRTRPSGVQVWNAAAYDTATCFDYGNPADPLRPVVIRAGRNTVFSGRLMVGSDQPIKGLNAKVTDLQAKAGARIPAAAVRVRYAAPATEAKSWLPPYRFDGLLDTIPAEIPLAEIRREPNSDLIGYTGDNWLHPTWYGASNPLYKELKPRISGAVAPLWFTVRVPRDAAPGLYVGQVTVAAEGLPATTVPLQVQVSTWTAPDPQDFRVQNFLYYAEEVIPQHYGVPYWSDRHFEILGQHLSLLAEVNSRQMMANLVTGYFQYRGIASPADESLVRWIKQPDGSYKRDFTNFDKYLDLVARKVGKPNTLRLNFADGLGDVTVQNAATGRLSRMPPPTPGTEENYRFWKPVIDEVLARIKARGWLEDTTLGGNEAGWQPPDKLVDIAHRLWPEGEWSSSAHYIADGVVFEGSAKNVRMKVRHADGCLSKPSGKLPPLWTLDGPRRYSFVWTSKGQLDDKSPLREYRRQVEATGMMGGYDGVGDFGANLFPIKAANGAYTTVSAGRGTRWAQQYDCIFSLLYPGPDGAVATERYEMFREGLELCEAILFVQNAIHKKQLSADLEQRAKRYLHPQEKPALMTQQIRGERDNAFNRGWFSANYMMDVEDAKLLDLAGEVARELEGKKR